MPVQMIELEEVQMFEKSDEVLEAVVRGGMIYSIVNASFPLFVPGCSPSPTSV